MAQSVKVVSADELSNYLATKGYPFDADRLESLAKDRLIPFVLVDGKHLRFFLREAAKAVIEEFANRKEVVERVSPVPVFVDRLPVAGERAVPRSLSGLVENLHEAYVQVFSGVYFLCRGGEVVYVGSSNNVYTRIANHCPQCRKAINAGLAGKKLRERYVGEMKE